jgi:hypothetical protein
MSLARLGPPYSTARILVSVGNHAIHELVVKQTSSWARGFPIEWHMVSNHMCETDPAPSGNDRYAENPRSHVIILCDADVCVIERFDELLIRLSMDHPVVAGLQAHFPPFPERSPEANDAMWHRLFEFAGVPQRPLNQVYSLAADGSLGRCPPYFNYGFVAFNHLAFHRIAPIITKFTKIAERFLTDHLRRPRRFGFFRAQVGLSLAIAAADVEALPLSHAYNCANDDAVFTNGLDGVHEVKAIHYLRRDEFDRSNFLSDAQAYQNFIARPLQNRISERLREHVLSLSNALLADPAE